MKSLKKYFSLCVIILLTSCSNTVNQISAEELVAQGCADYKRAPQSPEASIKFRKAANIDEKYRDLGYSKFLYKDALELAKKQGQLGLLVGGQLTTPFKSKATYKNFIQQELSQKNERGEPITVLTKWLGVQPSNSVKEGKNNPNRVI